MTDRAGWYRRPYFYGALLIALVALAVPVSQSIAGATPNSATAPVEKHTDACGHGQGHQQIGKVKFTRTKDNSIIVDVTLYGADSTRGYRLILAVNEPLSCYPYSNMGVVKVVNGHFHKVFEVTGVPESFNQFWLAAYNSETGYTDESTAVKI
jgi:hypothetical protein